MSHLYRVLLFSLIALSVPAIAQPSMDITLVPGQNNDVEVRVRPDGDFDGVFSSISFTIRWSNSSGASLGSIAQQPMAQDIIAITHSGPEQVDGDYRYQVFVGFGFSAISDIPSMLNANAEFTLCTIPVLNAQDVFAIVNDAWTSANNADYYVSLNGLDRTGEIYDQSTGVRQGIDQAPWVGVAPNVVTDLAMITIGQDARGTVAFDLFDAQGKKAWSSSVVVGGTGARIPLDVRALQAGVYLLRAQMGDKACTLRVVKH